MAQYNGYRKVAHGTYSEWRSAVLGNGYNVDYSYGNQCWDLPALLYFQYGRSLITRAGGGVAADCWRISRQQNSVTPFISLTGKENIKRGDILVWDSTISYPTGHIAFADEDYNGTNKLNCLGQNQGQGSAAPSNIVEQSLNNFLGIFRNTKWFSGPTPEPPKPDKSKKRNFPWAVAWAHWDNFKN